MIWLNKQSLIQLSFLVILVTGIINGWVVLMNIEGAMAQRVIGSDLFFPPPYVIGSVWTLLMLGLAFCFNRLHNKKSYQTSVLFLFFACVAYPIYTFGFSSIKIMFAGNLVIIVFATFLSGVVFEKFRYLASIILLIPIWVVFVTYHMFFIY
ncbi:hypothetical protein MB2181_02145 [Methylophilales bacterium HTCC2181]|uniref:Tryptophan-rich sensory protein n=1 Tax=Methylophilales bacterium HTCC2181 TaxID=383631 RepID=A0P5M6_9PROT|nr:hypothetical protein MB2181_02145 [Methylophilales bacterium HTCC2181]